MLELVAGSGRKTAKLCYTAASGSPGVAVLKLQIFDMNKFLLIGLGVILLAHKLSSKDKAQVVGTPGKKIKLRRANQYTRPLLEPDQY